MTNSDIQIRN